MRTFLKEIKRNKVKVEISQDPKSDDIRIRFRKGLYVKDTILSETFLKETVLDVGFILLEELRQFLKGVPQS